MHEHKSLIFFIFTTTIAITLVIISATTRLGAPTPAPHVSYTQGTFTTEPPADTQARKEQFIATMLPLALKANEKVLSDRRILEDISPRWITPAEQRAIERLAAKYNVDAQAPRDALNELLLCVDALPPSLILAQAAIESGWGSSRFAREGNNLFGLRRQGAGGMVPTRRDPGKSFSVSCFADLQENVDFYLWTLNTHPAYAQLRQLRTDGVDVLTLTTGLEPYSEQGQTYIHKVQGVITHNKLQVYDAFTLARG